MHPALMAAARQQLSTPESRPTDSEPPPRLEVAPAHARDLHALARLRARGGLSRPRLAWRSRAGQLSQPDRLPGESQLAPPADPPVPTPAGASAVPLPGASTATASYAWPGPYPYPLPPINVVVQNTHTSPQVMSQPTHSNVVSTAHPLAGPMASASSFPAAVAAPAAGAMHLAGPPSSIQLVRAHERSRLIAILLSVLLGWVGAQQFYLGHRRSGWILLALCWTPIPAMFGLFNALRLLLLTGGEFDRLYNYEPVGLPTVPLVAVQA